jgi:hypothetical protein
MTPKRRVHLIISPAMTDARYDDPLWETLQGNGWRDGDVELVDAFAAEFPDADEPPDFVADAEERLRHAALIATTVVRDAGVVGGPLWDELGVELISQWGRSRSRSRGVDMDLLLDPPER